MSAWRAHFSFNKYAQIASQAVRQGLKEPVRAEAERRAAVGLRVQKWENGQGGEQRYIVPPEEQIAGKSA